MPQTDESESTPLSCKTCALLQVGQAPSAEGGPFSAVEHDWPSALGPWRFVLPARCRCET